MLIRIASVSWALLAAVAWQVMSVEVARADQVAWKTDFRKAAQESGLTQKPILLQVSATWCTYCQKMFQETFRDQTVVKHMNDCFIPVVVDADKNRQFISSIGVQALPTTVIIGPDMRIVKKFTGYKSARDLDQTLDKMCPDHQ